MKYPRHHRNFSRGAAALVALCLAFAPIAFAKDITSTNFIVRDPVIGTGGGYGSSASFQLISEGDSVLTGVGSSDTYIGHYGFLYYPFVTAPVLSAEAIGSTGRLTWDPSTAGQGWAVNGYNTGIATASGGPYAFTDAGNVVTYDYTGLAPGDYCFVVEAYDAHGYVIATSNEVCITIALTLTFDIDTATTDSDTDPAYAVPLGTLTTGSVTRSNGSINSIWTDLEGNGNGGTVVTVQSGNGALKSASVPGDSIPSASATMAAGTANYGLCVAWATASAGTLAASAPFDGATCVDGAANTVGGLTTSPQVILDTAGEGIEGGRSQIRVNAAINSTTPAHSDYADTLTFIATSTF